MAVYADREHFIPIRVTELVDYLCTDTGPRGDHQLAPEEEGLFRTFARLLVTHYHVEYHDRVVRLKDSYAPFDPDSDTRKLHPFTDVERQTARDQLFDEFIRLLETANYRHLSREEAEKEMQGASYWGVDMDVCWDVFDRVELFYRGSSIGKRTKRHPVKFWKVRNLSVPIYQRMVLILKQKEHKRLGKAPDTQHVFLKMFKDIPRMDMEMLLPGTQLKMPKVERGKLGGSLLFSIGWVVYKVIESLAHVVTGGLAVLYGPLGLALGYGYRTWSGYQTTKQTYQLALTQSLYYQNLDNNAGVLYRLFDEAEEQECREALLGYYFLWRYAGDNGWTEDQLDDYVELDLERRLNLNIDFEIGDALGKLERLGLALKDGDRYRVPPIDQATRVMAQQHARQAAGDESEPAADALPAI